MASLSALNKRERKIRGDIDRLRRRFRKKEISKSDFDKSFEKFNSELEDIAEEKNELIGKPLPPLPPPPSPLRTHKPSGLSAIKRSILGGKEEVEPPGPPVILKSEPPKPPKTIIKEKIKKVEIPVIKEKIKKVEIPVIKEKIKEVPVEKKEIEKVKVPVIQEKVQRIEVPVIKERIREVPVIKEKIKEVPVIKEKIKKVPVVKTVRVPSTDPALAKIMEENFKDLTNIKIDVARHEQEVSQLMKDFNEIKNGLTGLEDMKAEIKALRIKTDKMDFQGLSQDIFNQINTMKSLLDEKAESIKASVIDQDTGKRIKATSSGLHDLQIDLARHEQEITNLLKEVRDTKEKILSSEKNADEIKSLRSRLNQIDFQGLSNEIYSQFDRMNKSVKESERKADELVEKMNVDIQSLKQRMDEIGQAKEHVDNMDITNIRRDMESLKQKSQYIEQNLDKVDMKPIVDMIKDVENKVNTLRVSSALIIE